MYIQICQWLATGWWFSSGSSSFLHQQHWPPRYNWNIIESGVKHYNLNPSLKICESPFPNKDRNMILRHMTLFSIAEYRQIGGYKRGFELPVKSLFLWLSQLMLSNSSIWSKIIPRISWPYFKNDLAMNKSWRRQNSSLASYMTNYGGIIFFTGRYLRHEIFQENGEYGHALVGYCW